ncbi:MAG: xanthine dehydrogenase family protein subunit M [Chloroflexi bacterium]|nr:xanthine dehydrogenase family protein subunit M [Chloroflexota bacterium]
MKPVKFDYFSPGSLPEALSLLAEYGDDAKILAGGQSLMPMMNMRLVRPGVIIDINGIDELAYISPDQQGGLAIGALTRQRHLERSAVVQEKTPLLAAGIPYIGHTQIRNRGTIGGSLAHADPAAELPAISLALDAEFVVASEGKERVVKAEEFFVTHLTTALEPVEALTEIRFPAADGRWLWGFQEVCRRDGDFALVGVVAMIQLNGDGLCQAARIVMFGVEGTPIRMRNAESILRGSNIDSDIRIAAADAIANELDPFSDIHASATYRKEVGGVLARRALESALASGNGDAQA